jgi:hypothetical protein
VNALTKTDKVQYESFFHVHCVIEPMQEDGEEVGKGDA